MSRHILVLIAVLCSMAVLVAQASAAGPNRGQILSITWTKDKAGNVFQPISFYEPGEKLSYRFTVTNTSNQLTFVSVIETEYQQPSKTSAPTAMHHLSYKLQPHGHIDVLYQTYAPSPFPGITNNFGFGAAAQAEGYPSIWLGSYAWLDTGK